MWHSTKYSICNIIDIQQVADMNITSMKIEYFPKYSILDMNIKYFGANIIADRTIIPYVINFVLEF